MRAKMPDAVAGPGRREWTLPWVCPRAGDTLEFVVAVEDEQTTPRRVPCPACGHDHWTALAELASRYGVERRRVLLRPRPRAA